MLVDSFMKKNNFQREFIDGVINEAIEEMLYGAEV